MPNRILKFRPIRFLPVVLLVFLACIVANGPTQNQANTAPSFTQDAIAMTAAATVGVAYRDTVHARDNDGAVLSFSFIDSVAGMVLADSILTWIPTATDAGTKAVRVRVGDARGGFDTLSWNIVVSPAINNPPLFVHDSVEMTSTAIVGSVYMDTVHAVDADGDPVTFRLIDSVSGMVHIDSIIVWTPAAADTGLRHVIIQVSDGKAGYDTLLWYVSVKPGLIIGPINAIPFFTHNSTEMTDTARVGSLYRDTVHATDANGDSLEFMFIESAGIYLTDSILTWILAPSDTGKHRVSIMVVDGKGGQDTISWSITVLAEVDTGAKWILQSFSTPAPNFGSVTWGNNAFVAVGDGGVIKTSSDGVTWTVSRSGVSTNLRSVVYAGQFVAVGDFGTVVTSTDGITWNTVNYGYADNLTGVVYGNNLFAAVSPDGAAIRSPDGNTWTRAATGTDWRSIAFGNGLFVAAGQGGNLGISTDGATWTPGTTGVSRPAGAISFCGNQFIMVAMYGMGSVSADGVIWTQRRFLGFPSFSPPIAFSPTKYVAVGLGLLVVSTDLVTWLPQTIESMEMLSGVAHGNGVWVVVGQMGTILTYHEE